MNKVTRIFLLMIAMVVTSSCAGDEAVPPAVADEFLENLAQHCGKAYPGQLVSLDEADADFAGQEMVMHVRSCEENAIRVPFHVGDDHSRTWVITRTDEGLRLKHDHRHEDGEEDAVTQYGGDAVLIENAARVEFPVDSFSIDMFNREGLTASVTNIWALELSDEKFVYELKRTNRHFRVEFDVTNPVDIPPAPWGSE